MKFTILGSLLAVYFFIGISNDWTKEVYLLLGIFLCAVSVLVVISNSLEQIIEKLNDIKENLRR
jgi:hypothetical protein